MSLSQGNASHLVPLLARILLAAAFIPQGWNKLTTTSTFSPAEAQTLRELGVAVQDIDPTAWRSPASPMSVHPVVLLRRATTETLPLPRPTGAQVDPNDVDDAVAPDQDVIAAPAPIIVLPPADEPVPQSAPSGDAVVVTGLAGSATSMHRVTLMVHAEGWPLPVVQAWAATAVELLGGALILVGLFSRLWGIALAFTMGVAFWMTSWPVIEQHTWQRALFVMSIPDYNRLIAQAGLFVLALGITLTGPGAVSIDRLLFRRVDDDRVPAAE